MAEPPNPYAAPKHDAPASSRLQLGLDDASNGARFVNAALDSVCVVLSTSALALLDERLQTQLLDHVPALLPTALMALAYYVGFEAAFGRTPGKMVTGTRVVNWDGARARLRQIVVRTLVRFVPFEALSFIGGWGFHDRWSGTRVIRARRAER